MEDLKSAFGPLFSELQIKELIQEVDLDNDSKISYEEFKLMMDTARVNPKRIRSSMSIST